MTQPGTSPYDDELVVTLHGEDARWLQERARASGRTPDEVMARLVAAGRAAEDDIDEGFFETLEESIAKNKEALDRLADL